LHKYFNSKGPVYLTAVTQLATPDATVNFCNNAAENVRS